MRIPLLVAIPLCLLTVGLSWWFGARDVDFLTAPSEARLAQVRADALASLPTSRIEEDAISVKVPEADPDRPGGEIPVETVDIGDISAQPSLDTYSERAPEGAGKLLALGAALEREGAFQRALLAYERVIDLTESAPEATQTAVSSIRRLKPTLPDWQTDADAAHKAVLHIGTGGTFADALPPILTEICKDLDAHSSGIVRFSHELHIGKTMRNNGAPTPVAVWMTGTGEGAPSTDVLSFTTDDPQTLRNDLLKTSFNLIRGHLMKASPLNPAPEALEDPSEALSSHITRLLWDGFGKSLRTQP